MCGVISCCYGGNLKNDDIQGNSEIFSYCLGMSSREANFASAIFKGIIYDLIQSSPHGFDQEVEDNMTLEKRSMKNDANKSYQHVRIKC